MNKTESHKKHYMVYVEEADAILRRTIRDFGKEQIEFEKCLGRVLGESLKADRDLPPFDRVSMDGIAIRYSDYHKGTRSFVIERCVAAGENPGILQGEDSCIEIMTGAPVPEGADTIIRYEDLLLENNLATIIAENIRQGQNIHRKGSDVRSGNVLLHAGILMDPAACAVAASVGASTIVVKKLPSVAVISTGKELVDIKSDPLPWQIRRSNVYMISALLQEFGIMPQMIHVNDEIGEAKKVIEGALQQFDVLLLSGGVSMGKFDSIPTILEECGVTNLFYKVKQRPGKPFWFGQNKTTTVFAFPGNPVSTSLCLYRYFRPWLSTCLGMETKEFFAELHEDVEFLPELQYFLQVILENKNGKIIALPLPGKGSGDFVNLLQSDAYMELTSGSTFFPKGSVHRMWPFKKLF